MAEPLPLVGSGCDKGRRKLVFHFEIIDKHLPNPVRDQLAGRCRIYFVAPKGSYALARNDRSGGYFVTPSTSQQAFRRLRAEIPAWHYPPEERGKPVPKMRPKSVFDDIITTVRYAVARWGVDAVPLTKGEAVIAAMPEKYKPETLQTNYSHAQEMAVRFQYEQAKKKVQTSRAYEFNEWLDPVEERDEG